MYHLPQNTGLNRVAPNTYIQGGKFKRYKYPFSSPKKWLSFTIGWEHPCRSGTGSAGNSSARKLGTCGVPCLGAEVTSGKKNTNYKE